MSDLQQDLFQARQARDEGIERVTRRNSSWMDEAMRLLCARLEPGEEVTGEDMRVRLMNAGLEPPKHHNAWGALVRRALTGNVVQATGRYRSMQRPTSHARKNAVYRVLPT